MWMALIKRYWDVSLLKETPAKTPYSVFLLGLICILFFVLVIVEWVLADIEHMYSLSSSLIAGTVLVLSYAAYTYILLALFHQKDRIIKTLSCLLAGHFIVHLFALPLLLLAPWLATAMIAEPLAVMIGMIYLVATLVLTLWQFLITVYVYKHATAADYLPAIIASLGLLACNILVVSIWR